MKKKNLIHCFAVLVLSISTANAQVPNWSWATSGTGSGKESSSKVISDNNGNTVVGGLYSGSMTLDGVTVSVHANNAGIPFDQNDFFMAKYNATGNLSWIVYPTGVDTCFSSRVWDFAADQAGNIYAFISFFPINPSSGLLFGSDTIHKNGALIKFDQGGNVIWYSEVEASSSSSHYNTKVSLDNQGNVYLFQNFGFNEQTRTYDTVTVSNQHPSSGNELILAKYNSSGSALWARSAGGNSYDDVLGLQFNNNGDAYLFGTFNSDTLFFDTTHYLVSTAGGGFADPDYFYAKCDSNGNVIWARSIAYGSAGLNQPNIQIKSVVNSAGEIFMAEQNPYSTLNIGSIVLNTPGYFISKADANGEPVWATVIGDTNSYAPDDIQLDGLGNIYVVGAFPTDSINLAGTTLYNSTPGSGTSEIYVAMFNAAGSPIGAFSEGGDDGDFPCFAVNDNGSMYLSGGFSSNSLTFGTTTLSNPNFPNYHMFLTYSTPILTGLKESNGSDNLSVFPNPANNSIQLKGLSPNEKYTIAIFNMVGQKMQSHKISTAITTSLDIQALTAGVYFMQIASGNGQRVVKFAKD
jgi:Secretion system C-terminal sorting domain